jgi:two-component system chemotaxis response regulator CheB
MVRVMVVDDSPLVRKIAADILQRDPDVSVVATAPSGELALKKVEKAAPDVITMDIEMPGMGGLSAIGEIMEKRPTPIIVLSASAQSGAEKTVRALERGAIDFIAKPAGSLSGGIDDIAAELIGKVKAAARVRLKEVNGPEKKQAPELEGRRHEGGSEPGPGNTKQSFELVAVGSSTGGPVALKQILTALPGDLPAGVVVVQHMPPVFTNAFAKRLDALCQVRVKEAEDGDPIRPGLVLIAPGGYHMTVTRTTAEAHALLNCDEPVMGLRPSVDVLLDSVARVYGSRALGVILTGMGRDGARGMAALKGKGGTVIAQDKDTSVIFGMNREVINNGNADEVLPVGSIAEYITKRCGTPIGT